MSSFALAAFAGAIVGLALPVPRSTYEKKTEQCVHAIYVHAMYANKYNGNTFESPRDTFLKCMKLTHPMLFKNIEEQYKVATTQSDPPSTQT